MSKTHDHDTAPAATDNDKGPTMTDRRAALSQIGAIASVAPAVALLLKPGSANAQLGSLGNPIAGPDL